MDNPKNLIYAAAFTFISAYGAEFNPLQVPFVADMYKEAQAKAAYMVNTGDISEMGELTGMVTKLQKAQSGDINALLSLAQEQDAPPAEAVDESTTYLLTY